MEGWGKLNSPSEMKQEPELGLNQVSGLQLPSSGHLHRGTRELGKWPQALAELTHLGVPWRQKFPPWEAGCKALSRAGSGP